MKLTLQALTALGLLLAVPYPGAAASTASTAVRALPSLPYSAGLSGSATIDWP